MPNCPICNQPLTEIKGNYGYGFECRAKYFYLEKDYPICHYAYRNFVKEIKEEYRYLLYPFVLYSYPNAQYSKLILLYKEGDMLTKYHHGMLNIITLPCIKPDLSNLDKLFEKFNMYLTFL
jgi:hypothetical protein